VTHRHGRLTSVDQVNGYGRANGWTIRPRTLIVEGTSDVQLFRMAALLERQSTGVDLLAGGFSILAGGEAERGGARGVVRELTTLRSLARSVRLPDGRPRYRFIGLVDDDKAGREAIKGARMVDSSVMEYKDLFRLRPHMIVNTNLDPKTLRKSFEDANRRYNTLDWELEDLLPEDMVDSFLADFPTATPRVTRQHGRTHRDFSWDGKHRLHKFVEQHAFGTDLDSVAHVIRAMRYYLRIPTPHSVRQKTV